MTVREMREWLEEFDQEAEVLVVVSDRDVPAREVPLERGEYPEGQPGRAFESTWFYDDYPVGNSHRTLILGES